MAHCNRDLHIGAQLQLADADRLTGNPGADTIGERCGAIFKPARIGVWDQARTFVPV